MPPESQLDRGPSTVAALMCALGGAIASTPLALRAPWADSFMKDSPGTVVMVALLTAAVTLFVVALSVRTSLIALLPFSAIGGAVVAAAALFGVMLSGIVGKDSVGNESVEHIPMLILLIALAGIVGSVVGALYAFIYAAPAAIAQRYQREQTPHGGARTAFACSIWLALVSVLAIASNPELDTSHIGIFTAVAGVVVAVVVGASARRRY